MVALLAESSCSADVISFIFAHPVVVGHFLCAHCSSQICDDFPFLKILM